MSKGKSKKILVGLDSEISRRLINNVVGSENIHDLKHDQVISAYHDNTRKKKNISRFKLRSFWDETVLGAFLASTIFLPIFVFQLIAKICWRQVRLRRSVGKMNISAVVIDNSRSIYAPLDAIIFARSRKLKVFLWMYANPGRMQSLLNMRKAQIYRSVMLERKINFYRPAEAVTLRLLNLHPGNPWIFGTGWVNQILVDTEYDRNLLIQSGVEATKIIIASSPQLNYVLTNNNKSRNAVHKCVIALPQLFEHGLVSELVATKTILQIVSTACKHFTQVVVCLHPKMEINFYRDLLRKYDVRISEHNIERELCGAFIHISTYSTTVKLAIASGAIPVIYDPVGLDYDWFYEEFFMPRYKRQDELDIGLKQLKSGCNSENIKSNCQQLGAHLVPSSMIVEQLGVEL